jgi:hypothetical protein
MAGRGYNNTTQYGGPNDNKVDVRYAGRYDHQQQDAQMQQQQPPQQQQHHQQQQQMRNPTNVNHRRLL